MTYCDVSSDVTAHVFLDDGMETNKKEERCSNNFVKQLADVVELAAR